MIFCHSADCHTRTAVPVQRDVLAALRVDVVQRHQVGGPCLRGPWVGGNESSRTPRLGPPSAPTFRRGTTGRPARALRLNLGLPRLHGVLQGPDPTTPTARRRRPPGPKDHRDHRVPPLCSLQSPASEVSLRFFPFRGFSTAPPRPQEWDMSREVQ